MSDILEFCEGECPLTLCSPCVQALLLAMLGCGDYAYWCQVCQIDFPNLDLNETQNLWVEGMQLA